jgi:hypothetical protein
MSQLTIRTDDDLLERIQRTARRAGKSMNEYVTAVLDAATNPDLAGSEAERTRERLDRAGLLTTPSKLAAKRPTKAAIEAAGRRAAIGRSLADYVSDGR